MTVLGRRAVFAAVTAVLAAVGALLAAPAAAASPACDPQWYRIRATTAGWFTAEHDGYVRAYAAPDFQPASQLFQVCADPDGKAGDDVVLRSYRTGGWLVPDLAAQIPYLRADDTGNPGWAHAFRIVPVDEASHTYAIWSVAMNRYLDARTDLPATPVTVTATEKDREVLEIVPVEKPPGS